jgi:hypothetical protein
MPATKWDRSFSIYPAGSWSGNCGIAVSGATTNAVLADIGCVAYHSSASRTPVADSNFCSCAMFACNNVTVTAGACTGPCAACQRPGAARMRMRTKTASDCPAPRTWGGRTNAAASSAEKRAAPVQQYYQERQCHQLQPPNWLSPYGRGNGPCVHGASNESQRRGRSCAQRS